MCYWSEEVTDIERSGSACDEFHSAHIVIGVNLYGFPVSLTDFLSIGWLTGVQDNPYGYLRARRTVSCVHHIPVVLRDHKPWY